jgi:hypothetical protein
MKRRTALAVITGHLGAIASLRPELVEPVGADNQRVVWHLDPTVPLVVTLGDREVEINQAELFEVLAGGR